MKKKCENFVGGNFDTQELPMVIPSFRKEAMLLWEDLRCV